MYLQSFPVLDCSPNTGLWFLFLSATQIFISSLRLPSVYGTKPQLFSTALLSGIYSTPSLRRRALAVIAPTTPFPTGSSQLSFK